MIAGDRCTRACKFCAVNTEKPLPLDSDEPARVAEAVREMKLKHIVITAVARDDVPDGGANHFRQTILKVREFCPKTSIEVLVPDFQDHDADIQTVLSAKPDIYNHNLETVRRLTPDVRHRATYERSLSVLRKAKAMAPSVYTKSGMLELCPRRFVMWSILQLTPNLSIIRLREAAFIFGNWCSTRFSL